MNIISEGIGYSSSRKLDAFSQLHVARKLSPSIPIVEGLVNKENANKDKNLLTVLLLSQIGDADTEFVINKCLSVVSRQQVDGTYAPVQGLKNTLMFDDMSMATMLEITVAVIEENLGDFFRTALAALNTTTEQGQT